MNLISNPLLITALCLMGAVYFIFRT